MRYLENGRIARPNLRRFRPLLGHTLPRARLRGAQQSPAPSLWAPCPRPPTLGNSKENSTSAVALQKSGPLCHTRLGNPPFLPLRPQNASSRQGSSKRLGKVCPGSAASPDCVEQGEGQVRPGVCGSGASWGKSARPPPPRCSESGAWQPLGHLEEDGS